MKLMYFKFINKSQYTLILAILKYIKNYSPHV